MKINSVDKAITILNCFSAKMPILGVGEICKMTGLTASTASRILSTLESRGVVEKSEGYGRYQLGYQTYLYGLLSQKGNNLVNFARPTMEQLRDQCGEEVSLYVLLNNVRTRIERVPSKRAIAMVGELGERLPLHAGASGQVLLAFLPADERQALLSGPPLKRFTKNTITDFDELEKRFAKIRNDGYIVSREEREPEAYSVVAPIRNMSGQVTASLSIAGPVYRLTDEQLTLNINGVIKAAAEISRKMGFRQ